MTDSGTPNPARDVGIGVATPVGCAAEVSGPGPLWVSGG
jgi:hypothetical protein